MELSDSPALPSPSHELPVIRLVPPQTTGPVQGGDRIAGLLDEARDHRVVLLEAPAGFGKSTHLATWFRARAGPGDGIFAWLALTHAENDPAGFLRAIIGALRTAGAEGLERAELALQIAGSDPQQILTWIANDLSTRNASTTWLALDDLHLVDDAQSVALLDQLIDEGPASMRFLIASRSAPRLSLGRRRAAGELVEIGSADLRLTREETDAFLSSMPGLALDAAARDALWRRTEGWPAALQLAGIWLQHSDDTAAAVRGVTGEHRDLVEYLGEQVMASLDDDMTEFLLQTSVLDRFCADLCEAVTRRPGAGAAMERAERANLFVIPLDERGEWFRYHHLFSEFLRSQLRRRDPELRRELHRRAHVWHTHHGTVEEAFRHAVSAGERDTAIDMISSQWVPLFRSGRQAMLHRWISRFTRVSHTLTPEIADIAGLALASEGAPAAEVEAWADVAERARRASVSGSRTSGWASYEANARVLYAGFLYRDVPTAISQIRAVLADESSHDVWWVPGHAVLAFLSYLDDDEEAARTAIAAAIGRPEAPQRPMGYITVLATRSLVDVGAGAVVAGRRSAAQAITYAENLGLHKTPAAGLAWSALAQSLVQTGATSEALEPADRGSTLLHGRTPRAMTALSLLTLAQAQRLAGDAAAAHQSADAAEALLDEFTDARRLTRDLHALRHSMAADRRRRPASPGTELTETELLVLRHLANGATVRETAAELNVSSNTIKTHASHVYRKLGVGSRQEALAAARAQGLL